MKIQGPNLANINAYKNQNQKQAESNKAANQKDKLDISSEAKQLLKSEKPSAERAAYIQKIKNAVESGEYKVNHEKAAQKMIDFWSNR